MIYVHGQKDFHVKTAVSMVHPAVLMQRTLNQSLLIRAALHTLCRYSHTKKPTLFS